jgi:hypothetical protein
MLADSERDRLPNLARPAMCRIARCVPAMPQYRDAPPKFPGMLSMARRLVRPRPDAIPSSTRPGSGQAAIKVIGGNPYEPANVRGDAAAVRRQMRAINYGLRSRCSRKRSITRSSCLIGIEGPAFRQPTAFAARRRTLLRSQCPARVCNRSLAKDAWASLRSGNGLLPVPE